MGPCATRPPGRDFLRTVTRSATSAAARSRVDGSAAPPYHRARGPPSPPREAPRSMPSRSSNWEASLPVATRLGPVRIVDRLGAGAMGAVYLAEMVEAREYAPIGSRVAV